MVGLERMLSAKVVDSELERFHCKCFSSHHFRLQFDETSGVYSDLNGVNVSVPGFGDTFSVECLADSELICATIPDLKYFQDFVEYFVARGYRRGVNLRAAPYDWRLAAG